MPKKSSIELLSTYDLERVTRSKKTPKFVEDKREEVLSRNPDLERKLLEAELDLARFQKTRQKSIMLRLAEEEARRADRHWRSQSTTIEDASNMPRRLMEAGLGIAGGATGAALFLSKSHAAQREAIERTHPNIFVTPDVVIDQVYHQPSAKKAAAERILKKRPALWRALSSHGDAWAEDLPGRHGVIDKAIRIIDDDVTKIIPEEKMGSDVRAAIAELRAEYEKEYAAATEPSRKFHAAVAEAKSAVAKKLEPVTKPLRGAFSIAGASKAELRHRATDTARVTVDGAEVTYEQAMKKYVESRRGLRAARKAVADLENLKPTKKPTKKAAEALSDDAVIRTRSRPQLKLVESDSEVVKPSTAAEVNKLKKQAAASLSELEASTKVLRGQARAVGGVRKGIYSNLLKARMQARVGIGLGAAALIGAGIVGAKIYKAYKDPSQRVKESWEERRRLYGPSGVSPEALRRV